MTSPSGLTLSYQVEHVTHFEGDLIITWLFGGQMPISMVPHLPAYLSKNSVHIGLSLFMVKLHQVNLWYPFCLYISFMNFSIICINFCALGV